jgi:lipoprotein NlpI
MKLRTVSLPALLLCVAAVAAADVDALVAAAREALKKGDTVRALALANAAVGAAPGRPPGYAVRAAAHDARREFEKSAADYGKVIEIAPDNLPAYQRRGEALFRLGRFRESVADFDQVIRLDPSREPHHWQRGISLYYAGEYARGARQFEAHRAVNPDDVENAAWHFLCVAREGGVEAARRSLIPVRHDGRVPMMRVHELLAGKATPADVLAAAGAGDPPPGAEAMKRRLFYAHLYIGLYHEAAGDAEKAREHILLAAGEYADDDYMSDVARAHAAVLRRH